MSRDDEPTKKIIPNLDSSYTYFPPIQDIAEFNLAIRQYGRPIQHTHSVACPCVDVDRFGGTGVAKPNCVSCGGLGLYFVVEETNEYRALVSSAENNPEQREEGNYTAGTVQLTVPGDVSISEGDRIVFKHEEIPIPYIRRYVASVGGFRLPFRASRVEVLTTKYADPKKGVIFLHEGKDYVLDVAKRWLSFPKGSKVTDGMVVSGEFFGQPYYLVAQLPAISRGTMLDPNDDESFVRLPKRVIAARADLLRGDQKREAHRDARHQTDTSLDKT